MTVDVTASVTVGGRSGSIPHGLALGAPHCGAYSSCRRDHQLPRRGLLSLGEAEDRATVHSVNCPRLDDDESSAVPIRQVTRPQASDRVANRQASDSRRRHPVQIAVSVNAAPRTLTGSQLPWLAGALPTRTDSRPESDVLPVQGGVRTSPFALVRKMQRNTCPEQGKRCYSDKGWG
jgi:hypothetical protein